MNDNIHAQLLMLCPIIVDDAVMYTRVIEKKLTITLVIPHFNIQCYDTAYMWEKNGITVRFFCTMNLFQGSCIP